jgi:hypothetical protein
MKHTQKKREILMDSEETCHWVWVHLLVFFGDTPIWFLLLWFACFVQIDLEANQVLDFLSACLVRVNGCLIVVCLERKLIKDFTIPITIYPITHVRVRKSWGYGLGFRITTQRGRILQLSSYSKSHTRNHKISPARPYVRLASLHCYKSINGEMSYRSMEITLIWKHMARFFGISSFLEQPSLTEDG